MLDQIAAFCAELRATYGLRLGPAEIADALRALAVVGVGDVCAVRRALRLVCSASPEEAARFDEAFDAFFLGVCNVRRPVTVWTEAAPEAPPTADEPPSPEVWRALVARYSPARSPAPEPPAIGRDASGDYGRAAGRLIAEVRRGRSRRWRPAARGPRLDPRRTLRASLRTAGDQVVLRHLAHPRRNPRFVLVFDGSRSMAPYAELMLGFAAALVRRTSRARVLLFSTDVRDVTRELRAVHRRGARSLDDLGAAWGGGTRIGAALHGVTRAGARWLSPDTTVLVFSDGLDSGGEVELRAALHAMRRAGADVWWLHPHAGAPGFAPATAALRTAAPFVGAFIGVPDVAALSALRRRAGD